MAAAKKVTILSAVVPIPRKDGTSFTALRDQVVAVPPVVAAQLIADGHASAGVAQPLVPTQVQPDQLGQPPAEGQQASDAPVSKGGDGPAAEPVLGDDQSVRPPAEEQPASEVAVPKAGDGPAAAPVADSGAGVVVDTGSGDDTGDADSDTAPGVPKPAKTAPVAVWRDYAISQGHDLDEAAVATRADLIALYG